MAEALRDRAAGRPWSTHLPFPLTVVTRLLETEATTGQRTETLLRYSEGHYEAARRQFAGFGRVERIEVGDASRPSVRSTHTFLARQERQLGRGPEHANLNGLLARMERRELDGSPLEDVPSYIEESTYDVALIGPARAFTFLKHTRRSHVMRSADARVEERELEYDTNGNVVEERFVASGTRQGVAVPPVRTRTTATYATGPVRNAVSRLVRRDADDRIFEEIHTFYDGADFVGLPLGQVQAGIKTREERLVLDRPTFDTHYAGMDLVALGYTAGVDANGAPAVWVQTERKAYTPAGAVRAEMDPMGHAVTYVHDAAGLEQVERHEPIGVTRVAHDPRVRKPTRILAPDGNVVEMRYDAQGRLLAVALGGDTLAAPTRDYAYDNSTLPVSQQVRYRIDDTTRLTTVTYFDGRGKILQKRVERAPGEIVTSGWIVRNPWGQAVTEYEPTIEPALAFAVPATAGRPSRRITYDGDGRPVRTVDYNGGVSTATYLPFDIEQRDANDNDASPENVARGQFDTPRREQLDAVNRRLVLVESGASETRYTTGINGEILAIADALGEKVRYRYDRRGNRLTVSHRDAGDRKLWYDASGRAARTLDDRGNDIKATYDALGRIVALAANGAEVERYIYDEVTTGGLSRLREVGYPGGAQRFEYNSRGQVTRHEHSYEGESAAQVLTYEYDGMGKQRAVTYPDGVRVSQRYYLNGLVRAIDGVVDEVVYDARGLPTRVRYANGVVTDITYEPGPGKVRTQRTVGRGGQVLEDASYRYDRLQMLLTADYQTAHGVRDVRYDYDPLYQVTRVQGQGFRLPLRLRQCALPRPDRRDRHRARLRRRRPPQPHHRHAPGRWGRVRARLRRQRERHLAAGPDADLRPQEPTDPRRPRRWHRGPIRLRPPRAAGPKAGHRGRGDAVRRPARGGPRRQRGAVHPPRERAGRPRARHHDPLDPRRSVGEREPVQRRHRRRHPPHQLPRVRQRARSGGHARRPDLRRPRVRRRRRAVLHGPALLRARDRPLRHPRSALPLPPESTNGDPAQLALYTYAGNDPGNKVDPYGLSFWSVFGAVVGVVVGIVLAVVIIAAFMTGVGWGILAIAGVIGLLTAGYLGAREAAGTDGGEFLRGMLIGVNAGMTFVFAALVFGLLFGLTAGLIIGITLGVINFLAAIDTIAQSEVYQGVLGWSTWLMPTAWVVIALGAVFWILNVLGFLLTFGQVDALKVDGMRVDWKTGTIFTKGGWISNLNAIDTAFNMGNFSFVDTNFSDPNWAMEHEAGHTLNLGAFGSAFHFIGFVDEMITGASAFSEQLAESNDPAGTGPTLPMWI